MFTFCWFWNMNKNEKELKICSALQYLMYMLHPDLWYQLMSGNMSKMHLQWVYYSKIDERIGICLFTKMRGQKIVSCFLYYCFVIGILLIRHYFSGHYMFSGDSSGLIIVWDTPVKGSSPHLFQHWKINKVIFIFSHNGICLMVVKSWCLGCNALI